MCLVQVKKKNGFTPNEAKHRRYLEDTKTDADDRVLFANAPAQTESLLLSPEQEAKGISLY